MLTLEVDDLVLSQMKEHVSGDYLGHIDDNYRRRNYVPSVLQRYAAG